MPAWKLVCIITLALVALFAGQLGVWGAGEEGLRVVIRSTARTSILLFAAAFTASSLVAVTRSAWAKSLLRNRRALGVGYAISHAIHAAALGMLYGESTEFVESLDAVTIGGGGLAYVFTAAMALTSNDGAVAALGRRRWRLLHLVGGWYIWIIFAQSYLPRAVADPTYVPAAAIVLAVPVLRTLAWQRRRAPRAAPAA